MLNRTTLLGAVGAAALTAIPYTSAMAAPPMGFAGTFSGEYSNLSCNGCSNANVWGGNAAGAFGFGGAPVGAEVAGGYHNLSGSGTSADIWNIGGSVFWAPDFGRVGGTVNYSSLSESGLDLSLTNYGGFGEFFAGNFLTLGVKGGGVSAGGDASGTGYYVGGAVTGYVLPNLALMGNIDYLHDDSGAHITTYGVTAEFQVSVQVPISIYGGYANNQISGLPHIDQWTIGVRFYLSPNPMTLVEHHRSGTLGWLSQSNIIGAAF